MEKRVFFEATQFNLTNRFGNSLLATTIALQTQTVWIRTALLILSKISRLRHLEVSCVLRLLILLFIVQCIA
jgi:hypothetical protein